jgi:hypothetical protein
MISPDSVSSIWYIFAVEGGKQTRIEISGDEGAQRINITKLMINLDCSNVSLWDEEGTTLGAVGVTCAKRCKHAGEKKHEARLLSITWKLQLRLLCGRHGRHTEVRGKVKGLQTIKSPS